jgi:hypothetical protein
VNLREVIEENAQKLMGFTFVFLGVYDSEGKPLFSVKKNSYSENLEQKIPYIISGVMNLLKMTDKAKEHVRAIILDREDMFYVVARGACKGETIYVVYGIEKGWLFFSSVERAVKKAREFLDAVKRV